MPSHAWTLPTSIKMFVAAFVVLLVSMVSPMPGLAQSDSSAISGAVLDGSGALLPNAKITIRSNATGAERVVLTNESGNFTAPDVQPGDYTLRIEARAFSR